MGRRLRLWLSSPLCRAWRGGTRGRGPGLHHSVTFVTEEPSGPAVNSGTLAMVFFLGRSQGRRQLLGCVKSCGLTLWELSSVELYCTKSQSYPVPKHSGGAGSGTEVVPPSFLPFQAVSGLQQVTGVWGRVSALQQPWHWGATDPPLPMLGEERAGGKPSQGLPSSWPWLFTRTGAGRGQPKDLGRLPGACSPPKLLLLHPSPTNPSQCTDVRCEDPLPCVIIDPTAAPSAP